MELTGRETQGWTLWRVIWLFMPAVANMVGLTIFWIVIIYLLAWAGFEQLPSPTLQVCYLLLIVVSFRVWFYIADRVSDLTRWAQKIEISWPGN